MERSKCTVYGLVNNKKSNVERNNIIDYLKGNKPELFITATEISDVVGQYDFLVASSVTDLGNNTDEIMRIISPTLDKNASISFAKGNLKFSPDDKPSEVFPKIGRIYKIFRSDRSKNGLDARKKRGLSIGRKPGKAKKLKLDKFEAEIIESLLLGKSKSDLCKKIKTSRSTLNSWLKARGHIHNENIHVRTKKNKLKPDIPIISSTDEAISVIPENNVHKIEPELDTEMLEILINDDDMFNKCLDVIAAKNDQQAIVKILEEKLQMTDDMLPFEVLKSYMEIRA